MRGARAALFSIMVPIFAAVRTLPCPPPYAGARSSCVGDGQGRVVGESRVIGRRSVDPRVLGASGDARGGELVVDAPARVVVEGLAALRPPCVGPLDVAGELAADIDPTEIVEPLVEVGDFRVEDARGLVVVGLPVLDVARSVDDVDVAPDDDVALPGSGLAGEFAQPGGDG